MWVLLWLQMTVVDDFNHYHISTWLTEQACNAAKSEAEVLVTKSNTKVVCVHIKK